MALISVKNLKKTYGPKLIFENVSFELDGKDRVALVGRNGTGKTTILKILAGLEEYDNGTIYIKKDLKIGYLEQEPNYDHMLASEVIDLANQDLKKISQEMPKILEKMAVESDNNKLIKLGERYDYLLNEYMTRGGYEYESELSKVLSGLKIPEQLLNMKFSQLSGGEKTRVLLAKLLLCKPEILLLDEPTNHLDIEALEWLENYLKDYSGALFLVSHDRYFLDAVVKKIYELDVDGIEEYGGNYTRYTLEKELRYLSKYKSYTSQQYVINRMEAQIKKFRALNTPGLNKKANEIQHRLEKMDKLPKPVLEKRKIDLNNSVVERSGNDVLTIENLAKSYGHKIVFRDVNLKMRYKDRVAIIGNNGCGKTTLIRTLLGEEAPTSGTVKMGTNLNIGYLRQNIGFDETNKSILDYYCEQFGISTTEARNRLAKILFTGNDVYKKIGSLSGGEKKRLQLDVLLHQNPNFLILDEPTNHLDLSSREILEENLDNFDGSLLLVSHDRYFINKLATSLLVNMDDTFVYVDGNYEYFKNNKDRLVYQMISSRKTIKDIEHSKTIPDSEGETTNETNANS